jgi:hypothetical protein
MSISSGGTTGEAPVSGYQRPSDWLPLPTVVAGEQKIVGMVAVRPVGPNRLAIKISGAYTVDWGDGSAPANFATGATASHAYTWADIPASTLTTDGYRQVIVSITMQGGQTMTAVHFDERHPSSIKTMSGWRDIRMAGASVSTFEFIGPTYESGYPREVERFDYVGTNAITNFWSTFEGCGKLRQVVNLYTGAATDTSGMFLNCGALLSVPAFDLSQVTDAYWMFRGCKSLRVIPDFTMNTTTTMDCDLMFSGCDNVRDFGALNLLKVKGYRFLDTRPLERYAATNSSIQVNLMDAELTGSELNTVYTNLATIADVSRTISTITYNWDTFVATYTTTVNHGWVPGKRVMVSGVTPVHFNVGMEIRTVPALNQFTFTLSGQPASDYVSGGTVDHDTEVDVSGTEGIASDTPSIATAKGWAVYT